jgi:hypothetical protein
MSTNDFKNIIKNMLEGVPATFLDVDMTWNLPNELIISNQLLLLTMAKISSIPILPNTDIIYNDLNSSAVKEIQNLNEQLNTLQILAQKYCVQQFTLGSLTHQLFDDIITNAVEISNSKDINDFMNFVSVNKFNNIQSGGSIPFYTLINYLFLLILLLSTSGGNEITFDKSLVEKSQLTQFIELDKETFLEKDVAKSKPINMELSLKVYDESKEKQKNTLIGKILSLIKQIPNANEKMEEYISNFNQRAMNFSDSCEKTCVELMIKSYENDIFKNWNNMDTIDETKRKIKELKDVVHKTNSQMIEGIPGKMTNVLTTAATSFMTGDFVAPTSILVDYGIDLWDQLKTIKQGNKEIKEVLKETEKKQLSSALTAEEKLYIHEGLFGEAKFYCSFSFNLQLQYQNNMLNVEGDKVDYMWMIKLIQSLQENIDFQNTSISANVNMDQKNKEITSKLLESLHERFDILKTLIQSLSSIVSFGVYASLNKKIKYPTEETLDNISSYFDEQLRYLNELLDNLKKQFPKQEQLIQQRREIVEEQFRLQKMENELTNFTNNAINLQKQFEANQIVTNLMETAKAFVTTYSGYIDFGVKTMDFASQSVEKLASSSTEFIMSGPLGIVKGLGSSFSDLLVHLLTTPGGLTLAGTGMLVLFVFFKGPIFTFIHGGKKFIYFVYNGVVFVFQVIGTSFGYALKSISTFVIQKDSTIYTEEGELVEDIENYKKFLSGKEEGELYNPQTRYTGGTRRKRKTKKNKRNMKKKTHRNKKYKLKLTKRKKNNKTKTKY